MHQPVSKPVRPFVPFILNGRVWRYHFAPWRNDKCLDQICVEIPMKYYPKKGDDKWVPRTTFVTFEKKVDILPRRIIQRPKNCQPNKEIRLVCPADEPDTVTEIKYVCQCDKMEYDDHGLPVLKDTK